MWILDAMPYASTLETRVLWVSWLRRIRQQRVRGARVGARRCGCDASRKIARGGREIARGGRAGVPEVMRVGRCHAGGSSWGAVKHPDASCAAQKRAPRGTSRPRGRRRVRTHARTLVVVGANFINVTGNKKPDRPACDVLVDLQLAGRACSARVQRGVTAACRGGMPAEPLLAQLQGQKAIQTTCP